MKPDKFLAWHNTRHAIMPAIWFAVPQVRFIRFKSICPEYYDILVGFVNRHIYRLNVNRRIELVDCFSDLTRGFVANFLTNDFAFVRYPEYNYTTSAVNHTA